MKLNRKQIIGIVSKHLLKNETRSNMFIRDEIKQAIFDNGGIAIGILLPKNEKIDVEDKWENNLNNIEYDNLISQIKLCDGILLQGGGACDNYEMIVAKYCYDNNIPTLGICCGQNVIVRALGGTTKLIINFYNLYFSFFPLQISPHLICFLLYHFVYFFKTNTR